MTRNLWAAVSRGRFLTVELALQVRGDVLHNKPWLVVQVFGVKLTDPVVEME